jgi:hypothetical protein
MSPLIFGHLANLVFAAAYLVRNVERLRALSIVGCLLCACFHYAAPSEPLWTGIGWNLFFAVLNAVTLLRGKRRASRRKCSTVQTERRPRYSRRNVRRLSTPAAPALAADHC